MLSGARSKNGGSQTLRNEGTNGQVGERRQETSCIGVVCLSDKKKLKDGLACGPAGAAGGVERTCAVSYGCGASNQCKRLMKMRDACEEDADCLPGLRCINFKCNVNKLAGDLCSSDQECQGSLTCQNRTCTGKKVLEPCSVGKQECSIGLACEKNLSDPLASPFCAPLLLEGDACNPKRAEEGACLRRLAVCMESKAGEGDWKCIAKYSRANLPSLQSFCGEEIVSVGGKQPTVTECEGNLKCDIGMLAPGVHPVLLTCPPPPPPPSSTRKSGYGAITGHRVSLSFPASSSSSLPLKVRSLGIFEQTKVDRVDVATGVKVRRYNNGKGYWLWRDEELGGWKIGVGNTAQTGLLLQVVTSSLEVEKILEPWGYWDVGELVVDDTLKMQVGGGTGGRGGGRRGQRRGGRREGRGTGDGEQEGGGMVGVGGDVQL
eukprot:343054-Hanusia_phi.AAC.2